MSDQQPPIGFWKKLVSSPAFRAYLITHRHTLLYSTIGLALGIGFLTLGFWRTLLVAGLIFLGNLIGSVKDGNPRLAQRVAHFYHYWIEDNPFIK